MSTRPRLEVFESTALPTGGEGAVVPDDTAQQEARLAAFEQGYRAGWDDAVSARAETEDALREDIARSLQGLSFTYHEARTHVLRALAPLMADVAARLLPEIARAGLPQLVADTIAPLAELAAEAPVLLALHPSNRAAVEALLVDAPALPVTLLDEPQLGEGQASLRLGQSELRVDLDAALAAIRAALRDVFDQPRKDATHG